MANVDNLKIKITRLSDNATFLLENGSRWRIANEGLEGFGGWGSNITFADSASDDGGLITAEHISKVNRTINAICDTRASMDVGRQEVVQFFRVKEDYRVNIIYGTFDVFADGKIEKFLLNERHLDRGYLTFTLTLLFPNPYFKSTDDYGKNIASLRPMIAFPFLCSSANGIKLAKGTTGGIYDFAQQVIVNNSGDVATKPKIRITANGDVINPRISINGYTVRIIDTLVNKDVIELDFSQTPPTVKKNGSNFIGHCDRTSAFNQMLLDRGDNVIRYDADNGSSHIDVVVYYNNLYGAI